MLVLFVLILTAVAVFCVVQILRLRETIDRHEAELHALWARLHPAPEKVSPPIAKVSLPEVAPPDPARAPAMAREPFVERPAVAPAERVAPRVTARPRGSAASIAGSAITGYVRDFFTGGHALVRGGILVLFFGVAFLLRYLAEHSHIPVALRLSGIAVGAIVLLALGWRLTAKRRGYGLALQGGAVGILYLTAFSALRLYALLTPEAAFVLLAGLGVLSGILAVLQDSLAVALLGATGAFLAPFLASTGHGSAVVLFSYFLVLNLGILAIGWFRSWRPLNLAGFAFTFVLSSVWGVLSYRPEQFASTEPFLVAFFLLYVAVAVLYARRGPQARYDYLDGAIVFGVPLAAFGLQAAMLQGRPLELAASALAVAALYLALAAGLHYGQGRERALLVQAFTALGVAFATLAIPLALDARWSAASWALEGAALIWVGTLQERPLARGFGALLQVAAGWTLIGASDSGPFPPPGVPMAALMVGLASVWAAQRLQVWRDRLLPYEQPLAAGLFLWGLLWWSLGGLGELHAHVPHPLQLTATVLFAAASALAASEIGRARNMAVARTAGLALLPVLAILLLRSGLHESHPAAHAGWLAWPLAVASLYIVLQRQEQPRFALMPALHAAALWLVVAGVSWELAWQASRMFAGAGPWSAIAWALPAAAVLGALPPLSVRIEWPFRAQREAYLGLASAGLGIYLALWSVLADARIADASTPLAYLPLANPLDVFQGVILLLLVHRLRRWRAQPDRVLEGSGERVAAAGIGLIGFAWLNAALLRTVHVWTGIPYALDPLLASNLVQTALTIFWAVLALTLMLAATRRATRSMWLTGASLLGVVILKLFVVDLASVGTVERIVSFVGVGVLMLILGYYSPLPPAARDPR